MTEEEEFINEREKARYHMWKSMDSQVPITMDNGFVIEQSIFNCTVCNAASLSGEFLRVAFHTVPGGDLRLTGYGLCIFCGVLSTIRQHYRQKEDGTVYIQTIPRSEPIPVGGAEIIPINRPKKKRRAVKDGEESKNEFNKEDGDSGC